MAIDQQFDEVAQKHALDVWAVGEKVVWSQYDETPLRTHGDNLIATGMRFAQTIIHQDNVKAGWWSDITTGHPLEMYRGVFSEKAVLIHAELSEAVEAYRQGLMDDKLPHRKGVEVELADAVIRILDLAGAMGLDLGGAIAEKLAFNRQRPDHKPENRRAEGGKAF